MAVLAQKRGARLRQRCVKRVWVAPPRRGAQHTECHGRGPHPVRLDFAQLTMPLRTTVYPCSCSHGLTLQSVDVLLEEGGEMEGRAETHSSLGGETLFCLSLNT